MTAGYAEPFKPVLAHADSVHMVETFLYAASFVGVFAALVLGSIAALDLRREYQQVRVDREFNRIVARLEFD